MRAAGVPARVVTGYQGGEANPVDGFVVVRQSDAHAWAEIWLAGRGWTRVDPTAAVSPARVDGGIAAAMPAGEPLPALIRLRSDWVRTLLFRWEAVNNAWNQYVLGYNPQRQRELLSRLGLPDADWRKLAAALAIICARPPARGHRMDSPPAAAPRPGRPPVAKSLAPAGTKQSKLPPLGKRRWHCWNALKGTIRRSRRHFARWLPPTCRRATAAFPTT